MRRLTIIFFAAILASTAFAVDFSPSLVAADAEWTMHSNFERGRSTQLGQFLLAEMKKGKCKAKLDETQALLGMDPSEDLNSVTAYGWSMERDSGAMVIDAEYDPVRVRDFISQLDGYQSRMVDGYEVLSWQSVKCQDRQRKTFAIFMDDGLVVCADSIENAAKAAEVLAGSQPYLAANSILNLAKQGQSAFMAAALKIDQAQNLPAKAAILKQSDSVVCSAEESGDNLVMRMELTTSDAETAMNVDAIARGMLAMMFMQSQENPDLAVVARGVQIDTRGDKVSISVAIPVKTVIDMYYAKKINVI